MNDKQAEATPAPEQPQTLEQLQKKAAQQSLFTWLLIPVALLMLMTALVSNTFLYQKFRPLIKQSPDYRLKLTYVEVKQSRDALDELFKPYHELMQRDDVQKLFAIGKENENIPVESEQDLISLIEDYRSALFNLASNVPGSGEWHRYHREQLRDFIESARLRADKLKMLNAQKPQ